MAIVVVTDCSPIRALHHLALLSLCRDLYGSVIVPEAVRRELQKPTTRCSTIEITDFPGFEVRAPHSKPNDFGVPSDLDVGETEAITLAAELHADLLLMDERKGTRAARRMGLATIGVIGMLLEAKRKSLVDRVTPLVDRLAKDLKFYVAPSLRQRIAQLAGE